MRMTHRWRGDLPIRGSWWIYGIFAGDIPAYCYESTLSCRSQLQHLHVQLLQDVVAFWRQMYVGPTIGGQYIGSDHQKK